MALPPPPGYYVPAVLFFDEHEEFDVPSIKAHVLRLAQGGVTGILVQGSNGEAQHLTREERKEAIRLTRQTLDENGFKNTYVIAGTGTQNTRETIRFCIDAKEAGASHCLVLTPSTWVLAMTPDNVIRFHREVADASPVPTMIYNFPVVTAGQDLDSDIITTLAEHPNIVGCKLSDGNMGKLHRCQSRFPLSSSSTNKFSAFAGRSDMFVQSLLSNGPGVIGALVNIVPKLHGRLYALWKEGKVQEAMDLQAKMGHADWGITKLGGIGGVKLVVTENFGYGKPFVRGPLKTKEAKSLVGDKHYEALKEVIEMEKAL